MTTTLNGAHPILIAEDDEDDYLLTIEALKEAGVDTQIKWVKDGEELMNYLEPIGIPMKKSSPEFPSHSASGVSSAARQTSRRNEDSCSHAARRPCHDQTAALSIRRGPRGTCPS